MIKTLMTMIQNNSHSQRHYKSSSDVNFIKYKYEYIFKWFDSTAGSHRDLNIITKVCSTLVWTI